MKFTYYGTSMDVIDHPYNSTRANERGVELAIAAAWLDGVAGAGVEVGNVMSHYGVTGHTIVDRFERTPGVHNIDVFDITDIYDWVLSVSTIEHIGRDDPPRSGSAAYMALEHLRDNVRAPGAPMLVTVPLGYHPELDVALMDRADGADRACTIVRAGTRWRQTKHLTWRPYGVSTPWAESLWVGEWSS